MGSFWRYQLSKWQSLFITTFVSRIYLDLVFRKKIDVYFLLDQEITPPARIKQLLNVEWEVFYSIAEFALVNQLAM
jgi:hypothetical protein